MFVETILYVTQNQSGDWTLRAAAPESNGRDDRAAEGVRSDAARLQAGQTTAVRT